MPAANPNSMSGQIRTLVANHGPLTNRELTALLPARERNGVLERVTAHDVFALARRMVTKGMLTREGDHFAIGRPPLRSGSAGRIDRQKMQPSVNDRGRNRSRSRVTEQYTYPSAGPAPEATEFETVAQWMARTKQKPQRLGNGDVSPASQFQRIRVSQ